MAGITYVALAVSGLIGLKMIERPVSARRQRTSVTAARIIAVIDVAIKASGAAKPGPSSNEYSAVEPVWPVVTVWRAIVGSIVVVPIGASRFHTDVNGYLSGC
jgi:hypothetical protein